MRKLISRMRGGQGGFTLIELLVVIAILGVIAAIVALNVSTFFGRGTLQAANTELHQVQTAIISLMADAETGTIDGIDGQAWWSGGAGTVTHGEYDAAQYVYGPFRAAYHISANGTILVGSTGAEFPEDRSPWSGIEWNATNMNWQAIPSN